MLDPESWWHLAMAFLWGAVVATGFAGFVNTFVHAAVMNLTATGDARFSLPQSARDT